MGSLASRPKVPDVPPVQYVYVPTSTYTAPAAASDSSSGTTPTPAPTEIEVKATARTNNLLDRRRGRLGTVLTSFRGLLNDTVGGARKTLLGE